MVESAREHQSRADRNDATGTSAVAQKARHERTIPAGVRAISCTAATRARAAVLSRTGIREGVRHPASL
jgi:hypothetical protein